MSPQFRNTLETRIQELSASIETQASELAAYERVLQIELAKENAPTEKSPIEIRSEAEPVSMNGATSDESPEIKFTGNKTTLVADVVKSYGKAGAVPKDVEKIFAERNIQRSKNLVYNTLSYLVAQKKLQRRDGRYFGVQIEPSPAKNGPAPAKRRISPAGIKRIREAMKKRWAAKKAADRVASK
jgi:hypothetical protein